MAAARAVGLTSQTHADGLTAPFYKMAIRTQYYHESLKTGINLINDLYYYHDNAL